MKISEPEGAQADWEMGKPPFGVPVQAFVMGHVRRGRSEGMHFRLSDCTHPMQNTVASIDSVEAWRLPA